MSEKKLIEPMIFDNEKIDSKFIVSKETNNELIKAVDFDVRDKSFEEKVFILLYKINDDSIEQDMTNIYSVCIGRTECYNDIKNKLQSGLSIDIHRSIIITETKQIEAETGDRKYFLLPFEECISMYTFCIRVQDFYSYDEFSIEDYNDTEVPESSNELIGRDNYLTPEQVTYKNMLNAAMRRDDMIEAVRNDINKNNHDNNI